MRAYRWIVLSGLGLAAVIACGSKSSGQLGGGDDNTGPTTTNDAGTVSSSSSSGGNSSGTGVFMNDTDGNVDMVAPSACKAGNYQGLFQGSYSSGLIAGIPLSVTGDVNLTLDQAGDSSKQCMVEGEGFEVCSNVFTLSGGTITGVANKAGMIGDATIGGFPYYCTLTGTLDCAKKVLVNGWIQCTYCVGPLADGGTSCTINVGGHFAGPLTADYFYGDDAGTAPAFGTALMGSDPGTWNGAESLAGNNGMMPGPEGGPISDYLALDGGYGFLGKYGGAGTWNATLE
jgi:hypothetical protein